MGDLESRFPCEPGLAGLPFLDEAHIQEYGEVYRYFPRYADVDV
ncbi:MAG: hypothetical protein JWM89_3511 [Acidimicrobiales bacterium]|nr:hypothetical protein [Acidimicrobiales bacterium]